MSAETAQPVAYSKMLDGKPGSDFMVDVLRALDIDFCASNPTSSCRGIHESIINYGSPPNKKPEFLQYNVPFGQNTQPFIAPQNYNQPPTLGYANGNAPNGSSAYGTLFSNFGGQ